jgi:hypothetical protein
MTATVGGEASAGGEGSAGRGGRAGLNAEKARWESAGRPASESGEGCSMAALPGVAAAGRASGTPAAGAPAAGTPDAGMLDAGTPLQAGGRGPGGCSAGR